MFQFVQSISLSAILATGAILGGQNAMACGGGRSCTQQATCSAPSCAAPLGNAAPAEMQMDHAAHTQPSSRIRYQSAFQAPVAQPQYYAPIQKYRTPSNGFDRGNQFDAGRKIRGL
jgi:hypothetical protein